MSDSPAQQRRLVDYDPPEDIRETVIALREDETLFYRTKVQPTVAIRCYPCQGHPYQKLCLQSRTFAQPLTRWELADRIRAPEEPFWLERDPRLAARWSDAE